MKNFIKVNVMKYEQGTTDCISKGTDDCISNDSKSGIQEI